MVKPKGDADDGAEISPGRLAEFFAFIKSARAFKGDLSLISAPAFLLSPTSLTEFPSYWCEDPTLFVAPAKQNDKGLRSLAVLEWYLGSLRAQWIKRKGMKKKPLNPILGELFLGHWDDHGNNGRTEVLVEQVCHQPPITAYQIRNEKHGVAMEGYYRQKTTFRAGPCVDRIGHVVLHLDAFDEDYLITLPKMHLEGMIPPPPYPELEGKSFIVGSNNTRAEIEYSGRGWIRGRKNSFRAQLYEEGHSDSPLYSVEGQWSGGAFTVYDASKKPLSVVDTAQPFKLAPIAVKPLEEQHPLESRRVWHKVADAIMKGDLSTASREKNKLEEAERVLRKQEMAEGVMWETKYFAPGNWVEAENLLARIGQDIRAEDTKGIWRWTGKDHAMEKE